MARNPAPKATLQAQLVAVRRAASAAAMECRPTRSRPNVSLQSKQELKRDTLAAAAMTLAAVQASREALDCLPDAQRDKLAIALVGMGFRAVRDEIEAALPTAVAHV